MAIFVGLRRGALLGLVFIFVAIGLGLAFKQIELKHRNRLFLVLAFVLIGATAVGVRYRQAIVFRIEGATKLNSAEGGLATRLRGWVVGWEMGKQHALVGVGNAGYASFYGSYRKYLVSKPEYKNIAASAGPEDDDEIHSPLTHNEYLQIFVELGIVGVLLVAVFWFLVSKRLWKGRNNHWTLGALLGLMAFGVSSTFSAFSFRYTPGPLILVCVLSIGFAFLTDEVSTDEIALSKATAIASTLISLIACVALIGRAYNVYASQQLQGRTSANTQPLDFNFFPNNPAGNQALLRRYNQALELDPENAGAHLGCALLLFQMKQPAQAIPHAEFALRHGYSRPFAYALLAFACEQNSDLARASQVMSECVASYPQSIFARAVYAEMLRKEGKTDQMRQQQGAMNSLNPIDAQSWELALRMKGEEATAEAARRGLKPPTALWPKLIAAITFARAYHYLK